MKRGQITLFVALGLVVLLIAGIGYLAIRETDIPTLQAQQDAASVSSVVQQCLAEVGELATRRTLAQGGYDDLSGLNIAPGRNSEVVHFSPQVVPLWHEVHDCSENEVGCIGDHRPHLCEGRSCPVRIDNGNEDMMWQYGIERGVEEDLVECFSEFRGLPQLTVSIDGEPEVLAIVRADDTLLQLDLPLTITTSDGQQVELDEFSAPLDVDLERIYRLATEIYDAERNQAFLENMWLQLLATSSGLDSPIPPMRDSQLKGGTRFWVTRNVQEEIEAGIMPFFSFIQVPNAMNSFGPIQSPYVDDQYQVYAAGIYEYLTVKLGDEAYPLGVQFQYPYRTLELDINGEEFLKGEELPGTSFLSKVGGLTFITYKFRYTASWPTLVRITDPYAFDGQGVELWYGLEANVFRNKPLNTSREILTFDVADDFVDLASPEQVVAHTYAITVKDRRSGQGIPDAGITFFCGTEFQMGVTDERGVWEGKLPYCIGGYVLPQTIEFGAEAYPLDNIDDDNGRTELVLEAWPRVNKTVELYKKTEANPSPQELGVDDNAIVTITRQVTTPYDDTVPWVGIVEFGSTNSEAEQGDTLTLLDQALQNGDITQEEYDLVVADMAELEPEQVVEQVIDLVPGTFDISGFLLYYGLVQIPEEYRGDVLLPAQNFTSWNSGGVLLVEDDGVVFTEEFVYSDRPLILYVVEQPIPRNWTDLEQYQSLEEYLTYGREQLTIPET